MKREADTLKTTTRELVSELAKLSGDPPKCVVCDSTEGVRRFALVVDGEPLTMQPQLCRVHGDTYIIKCGAAFGEMLR